MTGSHLFKIPQYYVQTFERGMIPKDSASQLCFIGYLVCWIISKSVIVYYTRAQAKAHISVVKKIREQLTMEGKDKVFLLRLFDEALTVHTQASNNSRKKDTSPKDDFLPTDNPNDLINEGYTDYYGRPLNSPRSLEPGYLPANVPINKQNISGEGVHILPRVDARLHPRSPLNSSNDVDPSVRKSKGIHIPSHQPGFRQLRSKDSLGMNN